MTVHPLLTFTLDYLPIVKFSHYTTFHVNGVGFQTQRTMTDKWTQRRENKSIYTSEVFLWNYSYQQRALTSSRSREKWGRKELKACLLASPVPTPQNLTAAIALGPSATLWLRARPAVAGRLGRVAGGCCCFFMAIPIVSRLWLRPRITRWREGQQGNRHRDIWHTHTRKAQRVAEMLVDKNWEAKKTNPGLPLTIGSQAKKVFHTHTHTHHI